MIEIAPYVDIISPTLTVMPPRMNSASAAIMLGAIGLQESGFKTRQQNGGPARGFWQFEQRGGVNGVLTHQATASYALSICRLRDVRPSTTAVYEAMLSDDVIGCAFARLLLWSDPKPLPAIGDADGAWALYQRTWRPGKPHPERWPANYRAARQMTGV